MVTKKTQQAKEAAFIKAVEKIGYGTGRSYAEIFDNWLDFALSNLCGNPNEQQQRIWKEAKEDPIVWDAYYEAFRAYGEASEDYHDPLGNAFMERISHGQRGQFFTPESVCELMAEVTAGEYNGSIYDCACGSGRLLLARLKRARMKGCEPRIVGGDISNMCCRMVLLNMLINVVEGEIQCGDTLMLDYNSFMFYRMERIIHVESGVILSQYWQYTLSNIKKVEEERREWYRNMVLQGVFRYNPKPKDDKTKEVEPLPQEIIVDKNGQTLLFQ